MLIFMKIDHKKNRTLFFFMPLVNVFAADCTVPSLVDQIDDLLLHLVILLVPPSPEEGRLHLDEPGSKV